MRPLHGGIVLLNWMSTGITMPIMSLILLSRGCTLQTLGLALGIYSTAAIAAEIPSGVLADLWGRRAAFLLSLSLTAAGCLMLLGLRGYWAVLAAMTVNGLGRACSSGSLDALIVEETVARRGQDYLPRVISQFAVCQCAGISIGALLSGFLPTTGDYLPQLAVKAFLTLPVAALTLLAVRERRKEPEARLSLRRHLTVCRSLLGQRALRRLFLCVGVGAADGSDGRRVAVALLPA